MTTATKLFLGLAIGLVVFAGVAVMNDQNSAEVMKVDIDTQEVVEEVNPNLHLLEDEDAVKAAQAVIRKKEATAELALVQEQIKTLREQEDALEKELGVYWTVKSNIKQLIYAMFPEDPHTAIAIATCESGLKPNAYNGSNYDGSTDGGLWQINTVHDQRLQELGLDKYNPEDATKYARMLYDKNGWRDWVCYTHGKIAMN